MIGKILDELNGKGIEAISGMDATFLYGETPTQHMHVGSVAVVEGSMKFETFKSIIHSRLHLIPKLRKRLVMVPFSIDYPYWVDDPNFDIDLHIHHIALPKPGGWKELRAAASRIFSEPLDRNRPLWEFTFVEGLDNIPQVPKGSVAAISKMHHVAIDGMAGAGMLALIFDMTSEVKPIPDPKPWRPAPLPNELAMMMSSTVSFVKRPFKFPKLLLDAAAATVKSGVLTRAQWANLPTAPFTAPKSPLNGIVSARRKWNTAILSLDRVKALKSIMGTTLNDVVMAICAGALRRYLGEKKKLPNKPLVAMVPISTRKKEDNGNSGGNQLTNMLVQLATNVDDPIERLEVIHENTIRGKSYQDAVGAETLGKMAEAVPFGIANQAAQFYSRYNMSKLHNPVFNLTITNVPGPQFPIYMNGHKLLSIMGMAPIIDGMGLIITVLSYNGLLTISPTSDAKTMPDIDKFTRYIRESANELEAAILSREKKTTKKKVTPKKSLKAKSDKFFAHIKKFIKTNPEAIFPNSGIYQFHITDPEVHWKLDLNKQPGTVRKSKTGKSDISLTIKDEHLVKIAEGKLNVQTAFIQGRLKVEGDMSKAMKLGKILSLLPPMG